MSSDASKKIVVKADLSRIDQLEIGVGLELRGGNGEFQITRC